jgi:hypothetical protein
MGQELTQAEFDRRLREEFQRGADSRQSEVEELQLQLAALRPIASFVVVSRKWQEPNILVKYFPDGVSLGMPIRDFIRSLTEAIPMKRLGAMPKRWRDKLFMTEAQWSAHYLPRQELEIQLLRAADDVEAEMKNATMKAPPQTSLLR